MSDPQKSDDILEQRATSETIITLPPTNPKLYPIRYLLWGFSKAMNQMFQFKLLPKPRAFHPTSDRQSRIKLLQKYTKQMSS